MSDAIYVGIVGTGDRSVHLRARGGRVLPGRLGLPAPRPLAVHADVFERYDEEAGRFEVEVTVHDPLLGRCSGYEGWFEVGFVPDDELPADVRPAREVRGE